MKYFVLTCALFFSTIMAFAENHDSALIIDVRTPAEWETGHLTDAKHIEWQVIDKKITDLTKDKNTTIYVYCRSGNRSGKAKKILDQLGYTNVVNAGGIGEAEAFIRTLET
jgi:phage shock protein E